MKRAPLPFDTSYFEKKRKAGKTLSTEETFREIFHSNHWNSEETVSGEGSMDIQTAEISRQIPLLIKELNIMRLLDLPCGDFNWMSKINMSIESYIGGDIISDIIEANSIKYGSETRKFVHLDLIKDALPEADMLLCRDCLVHLSNDDILETIQNIKRSRISYLLTTTFPECDVNNNIVTGDWRIINLEKPPFNFPQPLHLINEKCTEGNDTYADKSLGLWEISDL